MLSPSGSQSKGPFGGLASTIAGVSSEAAPLGAPVGAPLGAPVPSRRSMAVAMASGEGGHSGAWPALRAPATKTDSSSNVEVQYPR